MSSALLALSLALAIQEPSAVLDDVVVTAAPLTPEVARSYVDHVANPPLRALSLATWRTPVCLLVENLAPEAKSIVSARIVARAQTLGIEVREGCRPNLVVIFTSDGAATASDLVSAMPSLFRLKAGEPQGDRGELRQFETTTAPVRWWTMSGDFSTQRGAFLTPTQGDGGQFGLDSARSGSAPMVAADPGEIYLNQNQVRAIIRSTVVVDARQTDGVSTEALADYISLVALAEVDPDADTQKFPTILNLWRGQADLPAMTTWDWAYLKGLYKAELRISGSISPVRSRFQLNEIARSMARVDPPSP
ncbi:hypothetical protein [Brevundimonas sp. SL130]|uniref:hypothetical protein n=1 Tax=Brevundimonas sp. SL130 TaxID=2995143 RepID=UPI00226CE5E7|nr:hypothetical protein [Brevundimonas sp. SL130]WAC61483.1 hypothetical protein OU998_08615 [Brevundimonas sp. SL130]